MTGSRNPWWIALAALLAVMWAVTIRSSGDWTYLGWTLFYTLALVGAYAAMWLADRIEQRHPTVPHDDENNTLIRADDLPASARGRAEPEAASSQ